jgi:hypothetical protein
MLRDPPPESERKSWLIVVAWSGVILVTIPFAVTIQTSVDRRFGPTAFLILVLVAGALGTLAAGRALAGRGTPASAAGYLWIAVVASVFGVATWSMRGNPEEAVHFVEYGVLGVLLYRALLHRVRDATIYPCAALLAAIVGTVDEAVQWLTPGRYWALRDVGLNLTGATLALVAIGAGLRPPVIAARVGRASVRRLAATAAALLVVVALSLANTPPRIAWYSAAVPGLGFARATNGVMLEYGHRYDGPETGVFRSRFTPAELAALDAARGAEAGAILAAYAGDDRYDEFLTRYTPITDPFVHEARVHLFRRDRVLSRAHLQPGDAEWYRWHVSTAYRENQILERWFPRTLAAANAALRPEVAAMLARDHDPGFELESRVSLDLVTAVSERQVVGGFVVLFGALGLVWWRAREPQGAHG